MCQCVPISAGLWIRKGHLGVKVGTWFWCTAWKPKEHSFFEATSALLQVTAHCNYSVVSFRDQFGQICLTNLHLAAVIFYYFMCAELLVSGSALCYRLKSRTGLCVALQERSSQFLDQWRSVYQLGQTAAFRSAPLSCALCANAALV